MKYFTLLIFSGVLIFSACKQDQSSHQEREVSEEIYLENGKKIAAATFAELSGQLQKAIGEGGIPNAIQYCQLNAYPLVDSLSKVHNAEIKRTSFKTRNPENKPTETEAVVLKEYEGIMNTKRVLKPMTKKLDNQNIAFYAPILVNDFCLNCHGTVGENLKEDNYAVIQQFYPEDKAIDYKVGDLRGMWSISFKTTDK